jgi:hypothetical protein
VTVTATQTQNPEMAPIQGLQDQALAGPGSADRRRDLAAAVRPLLLDIGIPVATYYLLRNALGVSVWLSLALSSIGPAVRAIAGLLAERTLNLLAVLMLAVNLAGIAVSFLTGDPRAMIAKDSIVSSVIAFAILVHDPDPRRDLDIASYGVVKMLPGGLGTGYNGLGWEPKLAFSALAQAGLPDSASTQSGDAP